MKSLKVTLFYVVIGFILSIVLYAYGRLTDHLPEHSVDIDKTEANSKYEIDTHLRKDGCYEIGLASDERIFSKDTFDGEYKLTFYSKGKLLEERTVSKLRALRFYSDTDYSQIIFDVIKVPLKGHGKLTVKLTMLRPETVFNTLEDPSLYFYINYAPDLMCGKELKEYREEKRIKNLTIDTQETNETLKPLYKALKDKNLKDVTKIIESGVSVNVKMIGERTPLHFSAYENDKKTSDYLLHVGADMEAEDIHKKTALYYAIENNATQTASLLLDKKAKLPKLVGFTGKNVRLTDDGAPPLFYAACTEMFDIAELLMKDKRVDKNQMYKRRNVFAYSTSCVNQRTSTFAEKKIYDEKVERVRFFLTKHGFKLVFGENTKITYDKEIR